MVQSKLTPRARGELNYAHTNGLNINIHVLISFFVILPYRKQYLKFKYYNEIEICLNRIFAFQFKLQSGSVLVGWFLRYSRINI